MSDITRLKKIVNKCRKRLGLMRWHFELVLTEDRRYKAHNKHFMFDKADCYAEVSPLDLYGRHFQVCINKKALEHNDLEKFIIHELLHALLWKSLVLSIEVGASRSDHDRAKKERKAEREEHLVIDKLISCLCGDSDE